MKCVCVSAFLIDLCSSGRCVCTESSTVAQNKVYMRKGLWILSLVFSSALVLFIGLSDEFFNTMNCWLLW